jgi:MFS family permease
MFQIRLVSGNLGTASPRAVTPSLITAIACAGIIPANVDLLVANVAGRLADRFRQKQSFLLGVAIFTVANAACGLAANLLCSWHSALCRPPARRS